MGVWVRALLALALLLALLGGHAEAKLQAKPIFLTYSSFSPHPKRCGGATPLFARWAQQNGAAGPMGSRSLHPAVCITPKKCRPRSVIEQQILEAAKVSVRPRRRCRASAPSQLAILVAG